MNGAALAAALKPVIVSNVKANYTVRATIGDAELDKFAQALSQALGTTIVSYIQSNALVSGTVTSGSGSGGSITGTVG